MRKNDMSIPNGAPQKGKNAFNCPHCGAFAKQTWYNGAGQDGHRTYIQQHSFSFAICNYCNDISIWVGTKIVFPSIKNTPMPNPDMPANIKSDYIEARNIANESPRGAAALLRLAIQKLCKHLGEKGKNPNDDIAGLVKKGLPVKIQQALDIVRVIGNNAVHPGVIDLKDDVETANTLFSLINMVVDTLITQPKEVDKLFSNLPDGAKKAIEKRDKKTTE